MVDESVENFVGGLKERCGPALESVMRYPHPFTGGGLVVVFKDGAGSFLDSVKAIYGRGLAPCALHCLRRGELFELSLPSVPMSLLPSMIDERPHLAYWLKHRGSVLHGSDLRGEVALPQRPRFLLENHLEACRLYFRRHKILGLLMKRQYGSVLAELDRQLRFLMSLALLPHGEWEVLPESAPRIFEGVHADAELNEIWRDFDALRARRPGADEAEQRASAFEAAWLFERFMARLGAQR